ncbi:MAG: ATP-dependent Clp protease ATP-binding subunit, partial [Treponema sp.]|nr:ATP-dependent Clp protease ATP-binding subunit [Treponema sp.]
AVRRSRAGVSSLRRPMGSFIFLGPTGVGKTQLAKALAKFLFGTEDALIRVDMSDYMEKHTASRLVGAPPGYVGYDEGGTLTEQVRQHPYSVVLLDEIEKAHADIFNLLLQMLEEGELSDNMGHTVSFRNTVIIMTSNAGARKITSESRMGFSSSSEGVLPYEEIKASAMEELKRIMSPELLNRIDDIIVFNALDREQVARILEIQLGELRDRLAEQGLSLQLKPKARDYMVEHGYDVSMGARPMRRLIQRDVEDELATLLLSGKRGQSDTVIIDSDGEKLSVRFKKPKTVITIKTDGAFALSAPEEN